MRTLKMKRKNYKKRYSLAEFKPKPRANFEDNFRVQFLKDLLSLYYLLNLTFKMGQKLRRNQNCWVKKIGWSGEKNWLEWWKNGWSGEKNWLNWWKKLVELVKKLVGLAQYKRNNNHRNEPNCWCHEKIWLLEFVS